MPLGAGLCPATASRSRRRDGGAGAKAACPWEPGFARRPQAEADAGTAAPARKQHAPGSRALHGDRKPTPTPGRRRRRESSMPLGAGLCPATASRSRRRDGGAQAEADAGTAAPARKQHAPGSRALPGDRKPKPTPGRRRRRESSMPVANVRRCGTGNPEPRRALPQASQGGTALAATSSGGRRACAPCRLAVEPQSACECRSRGDRARARRRGGHDA